VSRQSDDFNGVGTGADGPFPKGCFPEVLTRREIEILHWGAVGKTSAEQAIILDISPSTVNFHMKNIYKKLNVNNRAQAMITASDMGLIHLDKGGRKKLLGDVYDGFVEGNAAPLIGILDEDIDWLSTAPQALFPHAGHYSGRDAVLAQLQVITRLYDCRRFLPKIFVEEKDQIAVYLDVELKHRDSGNRMFFDVAHFWTFRGDVAVRYVEIFNTALAHDHQTR